MRRAQNRLGKLVTTWTGLYMFTPADGLER